ncbi:hypothetical protein [Streptomyces sp. NPDC001100]
MGDLGAVFARTAAARVRLHAAAAVGHSTALMGGAALHVPRP